jgi:amino acid transporter
MSDSGLLPPVFSKVHPSTGAPVGALVVGSLISYAAALLLWGVLKEPAAVTFEICITFALVTYVSQLLR